MDDRITDIKAVVLDKRHADGPGESEPFVIVRQTEPKASGFLGDERRPATATIPPAEAEAKFYAALETEDIAA